MSRGLHVLGRHKPLVGIDWLDFAGKATGDIAQGMKPTPPNQLSHDGGTAAAERARRDQEAANTKWYVGGAVAIAAIFALIVAKVVAK